MKEADIDKLLNGAAGEKTGRKCKTCENPDVAAIVLRWCERKAADEPMPSLSAIHRQVLKAKGAASFGAIRYHVDNCLQRSPTTGKRHDGRDE